MVRNEQDWELKVPGKDGKEKMLCFTRLQFDLLLAYALTVHACQGLTLDRLDTIIGGSGTRYGTIYTILTRLRTAEGLCILNDFKRSDLRHKVPPALRANWTQLAAIEDRTLRLYASWLPPERVEEQSWIGTPPSERDASAPLSLALRRLHLELVPLSREWIRKTFSVADCLSYRQHFGALWSEEERKAWGNVVMDKLTQRLLEDEDASRTLVRTPMLRIEDTPWVDYVASLREGKVRGGRELWRAASHVYGITIVVHRLAFAPDSSTFPGSTDPVPLHVLDMGENVFLPVQPASMNVQERDQETPEDEIAWPEWRPTPRASAGSKRACTVELVKGPRTGQPCGKPGPDQCWSHRRAAAKKAAQAAPLRTAGAVPALPAVLPSAPRGQAAAEVDAGHLAVHLCAAGVPDVVAGDVAAALFLGRPVSDEAARWWEALCREPQPAVVAVLSEQQRQRLSNALVQQAAQKPDKVPEEIQRHVEELARQVRVQGWVNLGVTNPDVVRAFGPCFPDSVAFLLFAREQKESPAHLTHSAVWLESRDNLSQELRDRVCDWMLVHGEEPVPANRALCHRLLSGRSEDDWPTYCESMRDEEEFAEEAMIAATAACERVVIEVVSSTRVGHRYLPLLEVGESVEDFDTLHVAHRAGGSEHFTPACLAPPVPMEFE
jgi:hypothetical protein